MALGKAKTVLISINGIIFIAVAIISYFSRKTSSLFPKATGAVSDDNPTEITPASWTFTIWAFIYVYQLIWVISTLTSICRNAPDILSGWFYVAFTMANLCNFSWLLVWSREYLGLAFVFIVLIAVFLDLALFFSLTGLKEYIDTFAPKKESPAGDVHPVPSTFEVRLVRFLVQNGVMFYATWVSVAACLNFTIFITYDLGADGSKAATGALCVLTLIIVAWFVLENFVLELYTRYLFSHYIVLLVGLSGILSKNWTNGSGNQGFVLFLLILSAILFIIRLLFIFFKEWRRAGNADEKLSLVTRT